MVELDIAVPTISGCIGCGKTYCENQCTGYIHQFVCFIIKLLKAILPYCANVDKTRILNLFCHISNLTANSNTNIPVHMSSRQERITTIELASIPTFITNRRDDT